MPGITDPSEEYFKDGLWAWVSDQWKKLVADASQFLQINIAAQDIDVEVKQTTPADLTAGMCGWDGSAWRKLPVLWGYSEAWGEAVSGTAVDAGNAVATTTAVAEGYVYILQALAIYHNAATAKNSYVVVAHSGITIAILTEAASDQYAYRCWAGELVIPEGGYVRVTVLAPGNGKLAYLRVTGYKMKVAE